MNPQSRPPRVQGVSAHAIALVALFVALGSGAYAAVQNIGANSVGTPQIQSGAVGPSELKKEAVTEAKLAEDAVTKAKIKAQQILEKHLKDAAVSQQKLQDASVGLAQMQKDSVGQEQLKALSVGQAQMQGNSVLSQMIANQTIQPEDLAPEATSTLYTDNNEGTVSINTDTAIASLSLPAGSYLVSAGVAATHTGGGASTRLECYIPLGAGLVDYAKERLQANAGAEPIIFTKQMLQGPATLAGDGTLILRCTSTNGSNIDLSPVHFQALRVANIVAQ